MAQACLQSHIPFIAEHYLKLTERLSVTIKKNGPDYTIVIQKDKVKLKLSLEEYTTLSQQVNTIEIAALLLSGKLGYEHGESA